MRESTGIGDLLTEQPNPASQGIDALGTAEVLAIINAQDRQVAEAVGAEISNIAKAVDAIMEAVQGGGRLFYIGAGTSGRLGVLDAAECPPTFNVPPDLVQGIIAGGEKALARATEAYRFRGVNNQDIVVGIAASGRTPYVLGAVAAARKAGARTIGISCTPDSELAQGVDIAITPLTGPEIVTGSTRMKAGTATKLVLNMISTAVMIKLGHVFGNLMVNVQPKNVKLGDRARRIVAQAAGLPLDDAAGLLDGSGGNVKTAIVMGRLGVDRAEAERRLASAGGRVLEALRNG